MLTATTLERTGANNAADFAQLTPGVTIVTGTAEAGDTQVNIRGINGARDAESSIALVVDGILKTNTAQLNQVQGTLRQVEILKGPQGALYGRNAAAGALVLTTLKPGDAFEGAAKVSYAQENTVEASAHIAGPLGEGAGFVLSGYYRTTDGHYRNLLTSKKTVDDAEDFALDGRLVFQAGPDTEIDAKARFPRFRGASINFNASFHLPNFAAVNPAFYEDVDDHKFRYYSNIRPTNDQDSFDASIKLEHGFDAMKLIAWALYSNVDQSLVADGTSANFARYTGAGAIKQLYNPPSSTNLTSLLLADKFKTQVYAAFASTEYKPSEQFTAGLALRYDIEDRKTRSLVPTATDPFSGGPINPGQAFGVLTPKRATFKQLQPKLTLSWEPTPNLNIYGNWGIGFKSGGFNNQGTSRIAAWAFIPQAMSAAETPTRPGASSLPVTAASPLSHWISRS